MASPFPYDEAIAKGSELLDNILKRVLPAEKMSEAERLKISHDLTMAMLQQDGQQVLAQLAINQEEAKSERLFVSGWRPYIGWVCGTGFLYHVILQPALAFFITWYRWEVPPLPTFDTTSLVTVLGGLLGIGTMRTVEKLKGVRDVPVGR